MVHIPRTAIVTEIATTMVANAMGHTNLDYLGLLFPLLFCFVHVILSVCLMDLKGENNEG